MKNKYIYLVFLIFFAIGIGYVYSKKQLIAPFIKNTPTSTPSPAPVYFNNWGTFKNGYEIKLPENWQNTSDLNGHAVLEPGKNGAQTGNFSRIVISTNTNNNGTQIMTTQDEFNKWYSLKNHTKINQIEKLSNNTIDKEKAIIIVTIPAKNQWSLVGWTRQDDINYYINAVGVGIPTINDIKIFNYLINSFKFEQTDTIK